MDSPLALPLDLIDLCGAFDAEAAEYLVVGGQAVALHGVPRFTKDADVWIGEDASNLERVGRALTLFGAPPATVEALRRAEGLDVVWMGRPPARIDLMKRVPSGDFSAAWARRVVFVVAGQAVSCVGRDDLIELKRGSGRPQDLLDIEKLRP